MNARLALLLAGFAAIVQAQSPAAAELEKELAAQRRLLNDWGGLTRYGSENAELPPSRDGLIPNDAGYLKLASVAEKAIAAALARK
jgi:hypothetical protein